MKLSLADRVALIYTSAGSMRATARQCGLSHQQVSRILHKAAAGESLAYYESADHIVGAVAHGFAEHVELARAVARKHRIPFSADVPVLAQRLELSHRGLYVDGELVARGTVDYLRDWVDENAPEGRIEYRKLLGDRVGASHLHWLSDRLRNAWLARAQKSRAYYQVSIGSVVDLPRYMQAAAQRITTYLKGGGLSSRDQSKAKKQLKKLLGQHVKRQRVMTPYESIQPGRDTDDMLETVNHYLNTRHAPATGVAGTSLADTILLQVDTRATRDTDKAKTPKRATARRNSPRNR